MEVIQLLLKVIIWIIIIYSLCNIIMRTISYAFYKRAKRMKNIRFTPVKISINNRLSGYMYNDASQYDKIIIMFGGSNYIAYNTIGMYAGYYSCPVYAVDFYGTQGSCGKMNLKTIKQSAIELYDWIKIQYPQKNIIIIGHSYGTGIAAYLASVKECKKLILLSAYRDLSDLYNKIIPIFHGPLKVFISDNINTKEYAKTTSCDVYIIGSTKDKTLRSKLQIKVGKYYKNANIKIYEGIPHEAYLSNKQIIHDIKNIIQ